MRQGLGFIPDVAVYRDSFRLRFTQIRPHRGKNLNDIDNATRRIHDATVHIYDCNHFDPYLEFAFTNIIADQLAFLRQNFQAP